MTEVPPPPSHDRIEPVDIQLEMQRSFLDYSISVIVSRALPDARDGLSRYTAGCCTRCTTVATGPTAGT